jgi:polygalacturonase
MARPLSRFRSSIGFCLAFSAAVTVIAASFLILRTAGISSRRDYIAPYSIDYNVRDFGAKGDGITKDTSALQEAIEAASLHGGVVVLPPGRYLSGTLHLRSNVTLDFSAGAILVASRDDADFDSYEAPPPGSISPVSVSWKFAPKFRHRALWLNSARLLRETDDNPDTTYMHYSLIVGDHVSDITLEGSGVLEGNRISRGGPKLIALKHCRHITIRGLTLRDAPSYNVSLLGSDDVDIENLRIVDGYADGIDPDNSRFVRIANCYIDTWDDAICAKASLALGRRLATENLVVTNCILRTSNNGFKFGTESEGDLRNVTFSNCVIMRRDRGRAPVTGVALESVDGGNVDGVAISNVVMRGVRTPIFVRLGNRGRGMIESTPGNMSDISIDNVIALDADRPSSINGLPGFPIRDVSLSNIQVNEGARARFAGPGIPELPHTYPYGGMFGVLPAYSLYARHVEGLSISNWHDRWDLPHLRPAAVLEDVSDLQLMGFNAGATEGKQPVVLLEGVRKATIEGVSAAQDTAPVIGTAISRNRQVTRIDQNPGWRTHNGSTHHTKRL